MIAASDRKARCRHILTPKGMGEKVRLLEQLKGAKS